jgi:hypothetical protein
LHELDAAREQEVQRIDNCVEAVNVIVSHMDQINASIQRLHGEIRGAVKTNDMKLIHRFTNKVQKLTDQYHDLDQKRKHQMSLCNDSKFQTLDAEYREKVKQVNELVDKLNNSG